jgi:hypothetical protein
VTRRAAPRRSVAKPKRKPGRPRRAVVPKTTPNGSELPVELKTTDQVLADQLALIQARSSKGERLANHEVRILRDAWLHDQALHLWPSLEAAAADLGVSPSSMRTYKDQGCPGIEPHSPIPKSPVLAWLLKRAHERGGERFANADAADEADVRWKLARAAEKEKTLVAQAEDAAQQGLLAACAALRSRLIQAMPGAICEAVTRETDRTAAESRIAALIDNAISDGARLTTEGPTA